MQNTNTNTILIVILIIIVAGFGAYWYKNANSQPKDEANGSSLQINLGGDANAEKSQ